MNRKNKKINLFTEGLKLTIILLFIFCSVSILKILLTKDIVLSKYLVIFGLFDITMFLIILACERFVNYFKTLEYLDRNTQNNLNKTFFSSLLSKLIYRTDFFTVLVIFLTSFLMAISTLNEGTEGNFFKFIAIFFTHEIAFLLTIFIVFEFVSVTLIFIFFKLINNRRDLIRYLKKIKQLYKFVFAQILRLLQITLLQIKTLIWNSYKKIIAKFLNYDFFQRNLINEKKRTLLIVKLKGDYPPCKY